MGTEETIFDHFRFWRFAIPGKLIYICKERKTRRQIVDVAITGSGKRECGMRVAVFSDIHSNLEALESVLEHASAKKVDRYVCLGDVVGYGANPNECIDLISSLPDCLCLLGNHDAAVLGVHVNMNRDARKAIHWTRERVTISRMWFLMEMEDLVKWGDISFCHSNPYKPRNWHYVVGKILYFQFICPLEGQNPVYRAHPCAGCDNPQEFFLCLYQVAAAFHDRARRRTQSPDFQLRQCRTAAGW